MHQAVKILSVLATLCFVSISAHAAVESDINVAEVRSRLHIIEGDYQLTEGSPDLCIAGNYKLREGINTLSLFAGGGIVAAHIQRDRFMTSERGCSSNYSTRAISNGFENREEVHCPSRRISYVRLINIKFQNDELEYTLSTLRVFENAKDKVVCKFKRRTQMSSSEDI